MNGGEGTQGSAGKGRETSLDVLTDDDGSDQEGSSKDDENDELWIQLQIEPMTWADNLYL